MATTDRPVWLAADFIVLTEGSSVGTDLPLYVHARAIMCVEDIGNGTGSIVRLPTGGALEVKETPQQVFEAVEAVR